MTTEKCGKHDCHAIAMQLPCNAFGVKTRLFVLADTVLVEEWRASWTKLEKCASLKPHREGRTRVIREYWDVG